MSYFLLLLVVSQRLAKIARRLGLLVLCTAMNANDESIMDSINIGADKVMKNDIEGEVLEKTIQKKIFSGDILFDCLVFIFLRNMIFRK